MSSTAVRAVAAAAAAAAAATGGPMFYEFEDYDYFGHFITNPNVKSYWIAAYILSLYWGLIWLCRHIFGDGKSTMYNRQEAVHNLERERNRTSHQHLAWTNSPTAINIFVCVSTCCSK